MPKGVPAENTHIFTHLQANHAVARDLVAEREAASNSEADLDVEISTLGMSAFNDTAAARPELKLVPSVRAEHTNPVTGQAHEFPTNRLPGKYRGELRVELRCEQHVAHAIMGELPLNGCATMLEALEHGAGLDLMKSGDITGWHLHQARTFLEARRNRTLANGE